MTRARLDPHRFLRRLPLAPHQLKDRITRTADAIVLCHLGVPRLSRDDWSLTVDGLLARPKTLAFGDLICYPKVAITSIHQCAGSPLAPREPSQRVNNITWAGTRLIDILVDCDPEPSARFVCSTGADHGEFGGIGVDAYVKDLPIERAAADVLIAYEMNSEPLPPEHGFPARLVVPGFYGTNSVKWLTRLTLSVERAQGPFTTRWYNDPIDDTGRTVPVWALAPQSVLVAPAPEATIRAGERFEIWGWAWADGGVRTVDISLNGEAWQAAALEPSGGRAWQRFGLEWIPRRPGTASIAARATANSGERQPPSGRRNAIHHVSVTIS